MNICTQIANSSNLFASLSIYEFSNKKCAVNRRAYVSLTSVIHFRNVCVMNFWCYLVSNTLNDVSMSTHSHTHENVIDVIFKRCVRSKIGCDNVCLEHRNIYIACSRRNSANLNAATKNGCEEEEESKTEIEILTTATMTITEIHISECHFYSLIW